MKAKEKGIHKGGYSRHVPLVLWLDALGIDKHEVPCTYCGTMLTPYNFIIDHKKPRSEIASEPNNNPKQKVIVGQTDAIVLDEKEAYFNPGNSAVTESM